MENFLNKIIEGNKLELLIDTNVFPKNIILKAAYNFLEKGYFFFKIEENKNILLQFTKKEGELDSPEKIVLEFTDELLSVLLRDNLEKENKTIREGIISAAIGNSLDANNFVEINTDKENNQEENQIDFDKDIDEILKEIENDPDLKIDEDEINKILKEIEEESLEDELVEGESQVTLDPNAVKDVKQKFQDR